MPQVFVGEHAGKQIDGFLFLGPVNDFFTRRVEAVHHSGHGAMESVHVGARI